MTTQEMVNWAWGISIASLAVSVINAIGVYLSWRCRKSEGVSWE